MRGIGVASLLLVVLVAASLPQQSEANWTAALASGVIAKVKSLYRSGNLPVLDHLCKYKVKPTIRRRKWRVRLYFKGRMWCPGWVSFKGQALTKSKSGVLGDTVRDFIEKAHKAGKITEEQAKEWLKK